ncbi:antibiotic biosynthesis monooxygenase [Streptomyces sp. Je 1-79]|uniref:antibiotic biosynthesis monooxygenase n=1 Tax=Streptomyces sp. Je 1-79 TaxID=2943847 RepID=UPI0021A3DBAC|nr:antibiotic biosynthesis monooxygenase [Streptomyces sp. Je 1-79]MCT4355029.1 antibiotic biosynthesis monooxygenase [Streptomyces sp. Je 1-79]
MKTVVQAHARPDFAQCGVAFVTAHTWRVATPERQRAAAEAVERTWLSHDWPHVGLLAYSVALGTDGDTLLHLAQWTDERAYEDVVRTVRADRDAEIDRAVPGIERVASHRYVPFRSFVLSEESAGAVPGCVALVEVDFAGPGPERLKAWVEAVRAALAADAGTRPARGGIAAHFHLSADGSRVLNYAEWESERAHEEWLTAEGAAEGPWAAVRHHPGLLRSRLHRYTPALSLRPGV